MPSESCVELKEHVVGITRCRVQYEKYFRISHFYNVFYKQIEKYEKGGKYLSILHKSTCHNYFIVVKCMLKSDVRRIILLTY